MAISQSQKVDFLYKKLGFTKTKTGLSVDGTLSGTKKAGFGEVFASPLVIADGAVWNQSELIPTTSVIDKIEENADDAPKLPENNN